MGKYFNVIQAVFASAKQVRDLTLLGWMAASSIVCVAIYVAALLTEPLAVLLALPLMWLAGCFFQLKIHERAMQIHQIPVRPSPSLKSWIWLQFRRVLVDVFCWYDKKLLIPIILGLALAVAGVVWFGASALSSGISNGGIRPEASGGAIAMQGAMLQAIQGGIMAIVLVELAILLWFVFSFAIHGTRTKLAGFLYLSGSCEGGAALKESNRLVKGQTLEALLPSFLNFMTAYMAIYVVLVPLFLVAMAGQLAFGQLGDVVGVFMFVAMMAICLALMAQVLIVEAGLFRFWMQEEKPARAPSQPNMYAAPAYSDVPVTQTHAPAQNDGPASSGRKPVLRAKK